MRRKREVKTHWGNCGEETSAFWIVQEEKGKK